MTAPILVFGWGNPSRGDDALGPLLLERLEALALPDVEFLTDFQLQVEHALDLRDRKHVLFVDAGIGLAAPFCVSPVSARRDASFTSHAMTPQAVLQAYCDVEGAPPPPATLLEISGSRWELGDPLSEAAQRHLDAAARWAIGWIKEYRAG